jgi:hypothetical protein
MVRAAQSASFVRLVAALAVVSAAPALSQACIDCCTGSGAVPDAWCLPINGCPTSGQCVNGRVTCVISTGTFACSECGAGGTRQCSPSSTGTCRPQTPRTETCNLCDDNANGVVDEGLNGVSCTTASGCNGTSSCSGGVGGCNLTASSRRPCAACAQGSQQCRAGNTFGPCQPEKETTEMCNGCDDNLNNEVDEGLSERALHNGQRLQRCDPVPIGRVLVRLQRLRIAKALRVLRCGRLPILLWFRNAADEHVPVPASDSSR